MRTLICDWTSESGADQDEHTPTHHLTAPITPSRQNVGFDLPAIHRHLLAESAVQTCRPCLQPQIPTGPHLGVYKHNQKYDNIANKNIFAIITINQKQDGRCTALLTTFLCLFSQHRAAHIPFSHLQSLRARCHSRRLRTEQWPRWLSW